MKPFIQIQERTHKCSFCGAAFLTRVGCREHEKAHTPGAVAAGVIPYMEPRKIRSGRKRAA